ncbi:MAG TPA: MgtC/SapB family protein [Candidatus Dormibacteraeota bacterium]|nr:MgtC/SapB family protein [Candidatus Dormibacteraeota bacterium]
MFVALLLGLVLGVEREYRGHPAGLKTMSLIAVGACLFTGVGLLPAFKTGVDPTRIAAQIVTGVGFLGAGAILRLGNNVHGLTTAAMIWLAAAVGMAVGFGYFLLAGFTTFIVLVMLLGLRPIELRFFRNRKNRRRDDPIEMNPVDE